MRFQATTGKVLGSGVEVLEEGERVADTSSAVTGGHFGKKCTTRKGRIIDWGDRNDY